MWTNRRMLMLSILFISVALILIFSTYQSYNQSQESIAHHVNQATSETVIQVTRNLDAMLETYEHLSKSLILNPRIRSSINMVYRENGTYALALEGAMTIEELITGAKNASPQIERILLRNQFDASGNYSFLRIPGLFYSTPSNFLMKNPDSEWATKAIVQADGDPLWLPTRPRSLFSPVENTTVSAEPLITLGQYMKNLKDPNQAFVLFIEIKAAAIQSIFHPNTQLGSTQWYILDPQNHLVYSTDERLQQDLFPYLLPQDVSGRLDMSDRGEMIVYHTSEQSGWRVVAVHSTAAIYEDLQENLRNNILSAALILTLLLISMIVFHRLWRVHNSLQTFAREISEKNDLLEIQSSELNSKNQELTRLNQMKDRLIANTSHELRTPIQSIIGFAESIKYDSEFNGPQRFEVFINRIIQSGLRLNRMVNDILNLSKKNELEEALNWGIVNLDEVIRTAQENVRASAERKGLQLRVQVHADLYVHGDAERIIQVLENLLINAIKFTSKGNVEVKARRISEMETEIQVSDSGIGIPMEWHEKIFEPFEQVDAGDSRAFGGAGLGLSIVKKILALHHTVVQVQSGPNAGSIFSFRLMNAEPAKKLETKAIHEKNLL
jgi:signal transduction histidine kinase